VRNFHVLHENLIEGQMLFKMHTTVPISATVAVRDQVGPQGSLQWNGSGKVAD